MKKVLLLILMICVLLCSCASVQAERLTVNDEIETFPDGTKKYSISVSLPEGMAQAVSAGNDDRRIYESADGTYYVVTEILCGGSAEDAIRQMTGYAPESLGMICTDHMSMPEYRFSWCSDGENGILTCTGIVAEDEAYCYCLAFCAEEAYAKQCTEERAQVMSSFGLYYDEGF